MMMTKKYLEVKFQGMQNVHVVQEKSLNIVAVKYKILKILNISPYDINHEI